MKLRLPKNLICALMAAGSMACIAPASASTDWSVTDTSHAEEAVTLNNGDVLKLLSGSGAGSGTTFTSGLITVNSGGQLFVHGWTTGQKNVDTGNKMKIASPVLLAGGTIHQEDGSYYFTNSITVSGTGNAFESRWAKGVVFNGFSKDADDADPQSSTLVIRQNDSTDGGYSTFTISGASSYEGTVQQVNNDGDVRMHLILSHSDALRNAHLQTLSADQKSRGDVLLNVQSANVRALSGSGTIAVARKQNDSVNANGDFFVSTLHVLGADNKTFSGTLAPGVSLAIGVDAAQTLSAATLGGTVVNEGSLTLQGTSTLTTSDMSSFMVKFVTASTADGANGFATTATGTYYVIRNHGALDGADNAIAGAVKDEAGHYVTEVAIAPESLYVVNSDMTYSGTESAGGTKPGNILINSGVLDVTGGNSGQSGFINGQVYVHGGATLKLSRHDVMGYWSNGNATRAIHLMGESESQRATLEINNAGNVMTSSTDMWLQGHATVSGSAFNAYAGNVYVLGTDNIISAEMQLRKNAIVFVEKDGSVEFTGGITYNTSNEGRSLIKSGAGLLTLDSQSQASRINNLTINEGTMRVHSALTTEGTVLVEQGATLDLGNGDKNLLKNATGAGNVTVSKNITMAEGESTQATGTLTVQGASSDARATLRVQPNGSNAGSVSSFSAYVLDNGVLEFINKGGMRQLTLEKLTVKGYSTLGTVDDSTCWHGTYNIGALIGAAGSSLELVSGSWVGNTTVFNLNGGAGSNFRGDLLLKMNQNSGTTRRVAANINSGAETLLQDSVVTLDSKNSNNNTAIGLGINTNATLKGLETAANPSGGIFYVFSGAAGNNASEYDSDDTVRTLTLGHGTTADDSYTFAGKVKRNLDLVKEGLGTQTFSGDMSGFNGSVSVNSGHLKVGQAVTIQDLTVKENAKYTVAGGTTQIASELTQRGSIVVESSAVLDLTGMADTYFGHDDNYSTTNASRFVSLVENTSGAGTVKMKGATIQLGDSSASYSGSSLTFRSNYEFNSSLALANWSNASGNFHWIVGSQESGGSIKVHNADSNAVFAMKNGQTLEIKAGGSVEADLFELGQAGSHAGYLTMSGGSLKTGTVTSYGASTFSVSGGTVEFTDTDAFGNNTSTTVSLNGATLKATNTAWKADGSKLQSLTIGNLTINAETQNSITLSNAKTTTQERTISNNASGTGKLVLDNLEFDGRLNIGGSGTTEFVNGATLGENKTSGFSLVANTDVILKGKESGGVATYNLAGTDVAINQNKTLYIRSGAELTASKFFYTGTPYGKIVLDAGAGLKSNDLLRLQHITNNGTIQLTTNNEKTVSTYSQGSTGVLELGDNVHMDTARDASGSIGGSFKLGSGAQLNIKQLGDEVSASLKDLTLAQNAIMGVYTDNSTSAASEADISVSGTLKAGSGAKLNANLTVNGGATIDVDHTTGGLHMGSTLTFAGGEKVNLSDNIISGLNSLSANLAFGGSVTLFSGVDAFSIGDSAYDAGTTYKASDYFNLAGVNRPWDFVIKYEADAATDGGTVSLYMETPEPATATLSLLALAALAAKRKRK